MSIYLIRRPKDIAVEKLPDRSDSDARWRRQMMRSSKMLLKEILKTGKLHGPMSEEEQARSIAYVYNMDVVISGDGND